MNTVFINVHQIYGDSLTSTYTSKPYKTCRGPTVMMKQHQKVFTCIMHIANMAENRDRKNKWKGETRNWRTMKLPAPANEFATKQRKEEAREIATAAATATTSTVKATTGRGTGAGRNKQRRSRRVKVCSLDCATSLIFFDAPVSRMVVHLHLTCRPPSLLGHLGNTVLNFSIFSAYLYCHSTIYSEMFATRIYPNHTVSSMCRLDFLGTHMEEDESPDPRSDAST